MQQTELDTFKIKLQMLQEEVEQTIAALQERSKPVSPDVSLGRLTRQEALQEQSIAKENLRHNELRLKKIHGALHRVYNKTFGECLECGDAIAQKRLEVMPENGLCIECATQH